MTLQNAYDEFIVTQKIRGNSPHTISYYHYCLQPFLTSQGSDTPCFVLTLKALQRHVLALQNRPISDTTVKTYVKGLKAFVSWLWQEEYIASDLSAKLRLPKSQGLAIDPLTDAEISSIFSILGNKREYISLRNHCVCALMLDSGLRKSEVLTLKLSYLHLPEGYTLVDGKGNKQRPVPLGLNTQKLLLKYTAQRPHDARHEYVFLTPDSRPIGDASIRRMFKKFNPRGDIKIEKARLTRRIYPHLLRHTFATRYLENGGNIYSLQLILGHSSLEMVKRYVHLTCAKTVANFTDYSPLDNLGKT